MRGRYMLVWWSRRSYLERGLIYALSTSIFILFCITILSTRKSNVTDGGKSGISNVCMRTECIHTASKILEDMDPSVQPCDDFYKFTCGGFLKREYIPDDSPKWGNYVRLTRKIAAELKSEIENRTALPEARVVMLMKNYYHTCMDTSLMREQGLLPFKNLLEEVGGWPVMRGHQWDDTYYQWNRTIAKLRKIGVAMNTFFTINVGFDLQDTTKRMIYIDQPELGQPYEILAQGLNNTIIQAYYTLMIKIAIRFGVGISNATTELYDVLQFEVKLASLAKTRKGRPISVYNKFEIRELAQKYPQIPWLSYINNFIPPNQDIYIEDSEEVNLLVPDYIAGLNKLLKNTPKRVLANYAVWRLVFSFLPYLTNDVHLIYSRYLMSAFGYAAPITRWKLCMDVLFQHMRIGVGAIYVRKFFQQNLKGKVEKIIHNLREEFQKLLTQASWMDEKNRIHALEKLEALKFHVGYPVELLDYNKVDDYYKNVDIRPGNFMQSLLNMTVFHMDYRFGALRKPINKTDWVRHSASFVVNAFYAPVENSIYLHAGILQGMFYNPDRPHYSNYGAIGNVVAHELVHGYDRGGRLRDKKGNLIEWWNNGTKRNFLEKSNCIEYQYGNYTVPEVHLKINGPKTLKENMADVVGVKIAYKAYKEWLRNHKPEAQLPGLNFTNEQMFWISVARHGCTKLTTPRLKEIVMSETYSPMEYRILGSLVNSDDFARDFNCPSGSRMNPPKKCVVW